MVGNTSNDRYLFHMSRKKRLERSVSQRNVKKRFKNFEVTKSISNEYIEINDVILSTQSILDPYPHQSILEEAGSTKTIIITNKKKLVESEWWNQCHLQNVVDLYLDMLRTPHYCGGISHVL